MSFSDLTYNIFISRAHDSDGDGFLDGLELYKSIHHAIQHNADLRIDNIDDAFKTGQEDQAAIGEPLSQMHT
jgi:hypothetical protein